MVSIVTAIVVLGILSRSVPVLVARAITIATAMGENKATFPSPTPALAVVLADIAALTAAEAALKSHLGTSADRDEKRKQLIADIHQLHTYVQTVVNANLAQAATIAADAAMTLRRTGAKHKSDLAVKQTVSGSVKVVAKASRADHSHEWQYSLDGGKTWTSVLPTAQAHTTITGLPPATLVHFRHRPLRKTGVGDWSQAISAVVS